MMTREQLTLFQANLFSSQKISTDGFVIEHQVPKVASHYHRCLFDCKKPLAFVHEILGLSDNTIRAFNIGWCDRSLPIQLPHHKSTEGQKLRGTYERLGLLRGGTGHEVMRGCITLPLMDDDGVVGIYGLRYDRPRRNVTPLKCAVFGHMPAFAPNLQGKVGLLCDNPFTVLGLAEQGYLNGVVAIGDSLSEMAVCEFAKLGIDVLVMFTDATTDQDSLSQIQTLVSQYGLRICEVPLPFKVTRLGKWDEYQWRLFNKRLTRSLNDMGLHNARYQA